MASHPTPQFSRLGRIFVSTLDHPWLCTLFLVFITALAIGGYIAPSWPQDVAKSISNKLAPPPKEGESTADTPTDEASQKNRPVVRRRGFGGSRETNLVIKCPTLFTPEGSAAFRRVLQRVEDLDQVAAVESLEQAPPLNIFGLPEPILPRSKATQQRFDVAKKKAVEHPMVVGQWLSDDAETVLARVYYDMVFIKNDNDTIAPILEAARAAAAEDPSVPMEFHLVGGVPFDVLRAKNNRENEIHYQMVGYGMITIMAILLFRGISVVLVVGLAPILGVFWTLGLLRYFGLEDNPFAFVILPVLLSLVAFADGVHMMLHIRQSLAAGESPPVASRHTLGIVGVACFLTAITTAIDMGMLTTARHEVVREFGWSCVLGVFCTWLAVALVIPLVSSGPWGKRLAKGAQPDFLDRSLNGLGPIIRFVTRHDRVVSIIAIAIAIGLGCVAMRLRPDDRRSTMLPMGSDMQLGMAHLDKSMGGNDRCSVAIDWNPETVSDEQVLTCIDDIETMLRSEPLIGHPLSIATILKALPGEGTILEKKSLIEVIPPPMKERFFSIEEQRDKDGKISRQGHASIIFQCQDLGTAAYKPTFERMEAYLSRTEADHPHILCTLTGDAINRYHNLYKVVTDLATSLGGAAIVSFFVLGFAYRSLRLGLIAIVPNVLPLLASAAFMVFAGMPLEITSICCFTICLGIAVDDTIHFLSRYQEELKQGGDHRAAIERAFQAVGSGMIMTTIVLVAGFSSVLFSDISDFRTFGSLGIVTFLIALTCDILLLPALLSRFDRPKPPAEPTV